MNLEEFRIRLYRLERRERIWRVVSGVLGLCVLLATVTGMKAMRPQVIETESLVLTDNMGRTRGLLTAGIDEPALVLIDGNGHKRIRLHIDDDTPMISLYDAAQKLRLQMSGGDEHPEVTLIDENGTPALRVRGTRTEPQVVIYDAEGKSRARLFVLEAEESLGSGVSLVNEKGEQQILITALPDGTSVIRAGNELLSPSAKPKSLANPIPVRK